MTNLALAPLVLDDPPACKRELVPLLAEMMGRDKVVRGLHDALDDVGRAAVQEATHDPSGRVDHAQLRANYGRLPELGRGRISSPPSLFLPSDSQPPTDLRGPPGVRATAP